MTSFQKIRFIAYIILVCVGIFILPTTAAPTKNQPPSCINDVSPSKYATQSQSLNHPKIGLALGGGGTRGAAHVGVLRVLQSEGIPIDFIAGTSMGAIVGGLYCAGLTPDQIEKKVLDMTLMKSFITIPVYVELADQPLRVSRKLQGYKTCVSPYAQLLVLRYLQRTIPECDKEISSLRIPFRAVALNLLDGRVCAIDKGNLGLAMFASSAIPSARRPVSIENKMFVDGGVVDNLPVDIVKQMGADIVIAVDVDERVHEISSDEVQDLSAVPNRLLLLQLARMDTQAEKSADIVIHPNVEGIGLLSRSSKDATRAIKSGEKAAILALPAIKAVLVKTSL